MLGLGGFGQGNYGMGIELGFKYPAKAGMKHARGDFKGLRIEAKQTDVVMAKSMIGMQTNLRNFTLASGGIAMAAGAATGGLIKSGIETEQFLKDMSAAGIESMQRFKSQYNELIRDTTTKSPLREIQDSFKTLKGASIDDDALVSAMRRIDKVAIAGHGTIENASKLYSSFYKYWDQFTPGTFGEKADQWASAITAVQMKNEVWLPELSSQMSRAAMFAASQRMSYGEFAATVGVMASAGLGEESGTAMKGMLTRIAKAEKELNVQLVSRSGSNKGFMLPILDVIENLRKKFGESVDAYETAALQKAFGEEAVKGILALYNNKRILKDTIDLMDNFNLHNEVAAKRTDSLAYALKGLGTRTVNLKDKIAESEIPFFTGQINSLDEAVGKLTKRIEDNPNIGSAIIGTGGITTGLFGGAALIGGTLWGAKQYTKVAKGAITFGKNIGHVAGAALARAMGAEMAAMFTTGLAALTVYSTAAIAAYYGGKSRILSQLGYSSFEEAEKMSKIDRWELRDPKSGRQLGFGDTYGYRGGINPDDPLNSNYSIKYTDDISEENIKRWGGKVESVSSNTKSSKIENNFNGDIKPTLVVQGSDPELESKIKKFYSDAMQEAKWQMMRRGEAPTELAQ